MANNEGEERKQKALRRAFGDAVPLAVRLAAEHGFGGTADDWEGNLRAAQDIADSRAEDGPRDPSRIRLSQIALEMLSYLEFKDEPYPSFTTIVNGRVERAIALSKAPVAFSLPRSADPYPSPQHDLDDLSPPGLLERFLALIAVAQDILGHYATLKTARGPQ